MMNAVKKGKEFFIMGDVLAFIVTNLPLILCLLAGVALLVLEVFLPGFGLPGVSGVILLVAGVAVTWHRYGVVAGLAATLIALALTGISVSVSIKSAANGRLSRSALILKNVTPDQDNEEAAALVGKEGKTVTPLNPVGFAEFDGVRLNVLSEGSFLEKDVPVRVIKADGNHIVVRPV